MCVRYEKGKKLKSESVEEDVEMEEDDEELVAM